MPRRKTYDPLSVLINGRVVGKLEKAPSGAIAFQYSIEWLNWEHAFPVSLSLPLRDDAYRGEAVIAVFDNLLPDSESLRRKVAEKVGAAGVDPYSMLAAIGHDCVGALQFISEGADYGATGSIVGEPVDESTIERLLKGLAQAPLGLDREDAFRISIAGAQEKTALLWHDGQWLKPQGITPTTHIFKPTIGMLPNGIDLSHSVENEYYCLKLASAIGLPVAKADIQTFGSIKALVVERFDRRWAKDGRLLRLPQEDFCQALSVPPTRKYQNEGGPSLVDILHLLKGSDTAALDQATVFKAQVFFWLIGATDGHAKNFSLFLNPGGGFHLTPLYDVLTLEPSYKARQIEKKQMRLSLSVGAKRHYKLGEITKRHFEQTGEVAALPKKLIAEAIESVVCSIESALDRVKADLPDDFPESIPESVTSAVASRLSRLS